MRSFIKVQTKNYTVVHYNTTDLIYSFGELVAKGYNDVVYVINCPSQTTRKHINKYLRDRNIPFTLNDILKDDFTFDKKRHTITYKGRDYLIPCEYTNLIKKGD